MPTVYRVKHGECVASIAEQLGFYWETLWSHPDNAQLKDSRGDAMVLLAGDQLVIPEKQYKQESVASDQRHRFRKRGLAKIRLQLFNEGEPLKNKSCMIHIDARTKQGETDGNGMLEFAVPSKTRRCSIQVGEGEDAVIYELNVGHLDPFDTIKGVQQRLRNLSLFDGEADGVRDVFFEDALKLFCALNDTQYPAADEQQIFSKIKQKHGS
jgi:hypothetical protein